MITFTINSASYITQLLDVTCKSPVDFLFFNDGHVTFKVIGITQECEYFESNSMTVSVPVGYRLYLENGDELRLDVKNGEHELALLCPETQESNNKPGTIASWIKGCVNDFHF